MRRHVFWMMALLVLNLISCQQVGKSESQGGTQKDRKAGDGSE